MQKLACPKGGAAHLTFSPDGDWLAGLGPASAPTGFYCWTRSRDWEVTGLPNIGELTGLAFHPSGRTLAYAAIVHSLRAHAPVPPPPPPGAPPPSEWRRRFAKEKPRPFTGIHFYPLTGIDEFVPNRVGVPQPENVVVTRDTWRRGLTFTPDGRWLLAGHIESAGFTGVRANVYHWRFTETDDVWQVADTVAASGGTEHGGALIGGYLALAGAWGVTTSEVAPPDGLFVPDVQSASAVAVAPCGELVAMCTRGGSVHVWHLRNPNPVAVITVDGWVMALAFSPNGETLAAGHAGGSVSFWDARTGTPGPERDFGVGPVTALVYAPDGLTLAISGRTGVVVVDAD